MVEFMPLVLTRMPGGNCHWQFRSLVLCPLLCVMSVGCCYPSLFVDSTSVELKTTSLFPSSEQDWDTKEAEVQKVTFKPTLSTFDEDILKQLNLKDDRKRAPTYWY